MYCGVDLVVKWLEGLQPGDVFIFDFCLVIESQGITGKLNEEK